MAPLERWSVDACMDRLRRVKAEAEAARSVEPIRTFFTGLTKYVSRHNPDMVALQNWARMYQLWDAHLEAWYRAFQRGLKPEN